MHCWHQAVRVTRARARRPLRRHRRRHGEVARGLPGVAGADAARRARLAGRHAPALLAAAAAQARPRRLQASRLRRPMSERPSRLREAIPGDLQAGLTVALVGLPQCLAYALLAGLPPAYGLSTAVVAGFVAAVLGRSAHVATGPTNTTGLLILAALSPWLGANGLVADRGPSRARDADAARGRDPCRRRRRRRRRAGALPARVGPGRLHGRRGHPDRRDAARRGARPDRGTGPRSGLRARGHRGRARGGPLAGRGDVRRHHGPAAREPPAVAEAADRAPVRGRVRGGGRPLRLGLRHGPSARRRADGRPFGLAARRAARARDRSAAAAAATRMRDRPARHARARGHGAGRRRAREHGARDHGPGLGQRRRRLRRRFSGVREPHALGALAHGRRPHAARRRCGRAADAADAAVCRPLRGRRAAGVPRGRAVRDCLPHGRPQRNAAAVARVRGDAAAAAAHARWRRWCCLSSGRSCSARAPAS